MFLTLLKYFNAKYCKKDKDILQIICDKNQINKAFEIFNQIILLYTWTFIAIKQTFIHYQANQITYY